MSTLRKSFLSLVALSFLVSAGCATMKIDLASFEKPPRPGELDAFNVFIGNWTWEALVDNATDVGKEWHGTAEWKWSLDNRVLEGNISAESGSLKYDAKGVWSWHPREHRYIWWMINNWGYPQSGTARYNEAAREWTMAYKSVGLDGTPSYGRHVITVVDANKLSWNLNEWADPLHLILKLKMTGVYKRK